MGKLIQVSALFPGKKIMVSDQIRTIQQITHGPGAFAAKLWFKEEAMPLSVYLTSSFEEVPNHANCLAHDLSVDVMAMVAPTWEAGLHKDEAFRKIVNYCIAHKRHMTGIHETEDRIFMGDKSSLSLAETEHGWQLIVNEPPHFVDVKVQVAE